MRNALARIAHTPHELTLLAAQWQHRAATGNTGAAVMALNQRDVPNRVRVVRQLPGSGHPMNSVMEGRRIAQLGSLAGAARADGYGLQPY